jgi:hypothetical protein
MHGRNFNPIYRWHIIQIKIILTSTDPQFWTLTIKHWKIQLRKFTGIGSRSIMASKFIRGTRLMRVSMSNHVSGIRERTLDRGMGKSCDGPKTIRPVEKVVAVAISPVGVDSSRWARGRRLRQLEDAVGGGRGLVEDDALQMFVQLADLKLDIIQRSLDAWLPLLV